MKRLLVLATIAVFSANAINLTNETGENLNVRLKLKEGKSKLPSDKFTLTPGESIAKDIAATVRLAKIRIDSETACNNDTCVKSIKKSSRCKTKDQNAAEGTTAGSHDTLRIKGTADKDGSYAISRTAEGFLNFRKN